MILLYNYLPFKDLGITIIALTLLIRLLLFPLSYKAARTQREIAQIQPKLKEVQKKFKDNREEQAKQLMALYREHKINPLAGIVPILIQLPVLIALYQAFMALIKNNKALNLYSFVSMPSQISPYFLHSIDLATPNVVLALIAGGLQFAFSKMMLFKNKQKKSSQEQKGKMEEMSKMMGSQMAYFMPIFTVIIALRLPAGLPLYWATTTLFSIAEQLWAKRQQKQRDQLKKQEKPS